MEFAASARLADAFETSNDSRRRSRRQSQHDFYVMKNETRWLHTPRAAELKPTERAIIGAMYQLGDGATLTCSAPNSELGAATHRCARTVQRTLESLVERGWFPPPTKSLGECHTYDMRFALARLNPERFGRNVVTPHDISSLSKSQIEPETSDLEEGRASASSLASTYQEQTHTAARGAAEPADESEIEVRADETLRVKTQPAPDVRKVASADAYRVLAHHFRRVHRELASSPHASVCRFATARSFAIVERLLREGMSVQMLLFAVDGALLLRDGETGKWLRDNPHALEAETLFGGAMLSRYMQFGITAQAHEERKRARREREQRAAQATPQADEETFCTAHGSRCRDGAKGPLCRAQVAA